MDGWTDLDANSAYRPKRAQSSFIQSDELLRDPRRSAATMVKSKKHLIDNIVCYATYRR